MTRSKLVLTAFVALIVAAGIGYAMGGSGRFTLQNALDETRERLDIAEARGHLLEARVSLYNVNFGDASRHFEEAKAPLRRVRERLQRIGKNAAAGSIAAALAHAEEGQRLAGKLDQAANARANDALEAIRVAASQ
jgi:C4-dicarboxylate-specific signal transduction histidine kinase